MNIRSIKTVDGTNFVDYKLNVDGIKIYDGNYIVEFTYLPDDVTIDGSIDFYSNLNCSILSQMVVSEYLFMKGFVNEAYVWDKKFKENIKGILKPKRVVQMPCKRWE